MTDASYCPDEVDDAEAVERERNEILRNLGLLLVVLVLLGLVGLGASQHKGYLAALGIGVLIFSTAFAGGGGLGFLFALPRVAVESSVVGAPSLPAVGGVAGGVTAASEVAKDVAQKAAFRRLLQSNTNLERISDWLTTMLVGVSLVQLNNLSNLVLKFRDFLAESVKVFTLATGVPTAAWLPTVGALLLVFGAVIGFLAVYLYTRLVLVRLFSQTEQELQSGRLPGKVKDSVQSVGRSGGTPKSFMEKAILSRKTLRVGDAVELMSQALYDTEGAGYKRVIEMAASLTGTSAVEDANYWVYLACAFGQKHHVLTVDEGRHAYDPEVLSTKMNVMDAVGRALMLRPSVADWLLRLTHYGTLDDDLQDFANDPQFMNLIRNPPSRG